MSHGKRAIALLWFIYPRNASLKCTLVAKRGHDVNGALLTLPPPHSRRWEVLGAPPLLPAFSYG